MLSGDEQLNSGNVMAKFLLDGDMDSAILFLKSLGSDLERKQALWATIAVQGGAIKSLAKELGIDPVRILGNIITNRAAGIEE